ncbi:MAG: COX15/CtaA family protein [Pseudomonadales bacterium]|nr:COX15/CtaA family protein [Pseudomonadales bacterium]
MLPLEPKSRRKPGYRFAAGATAFAMCVVMLGAFTRLVDAGLGCPDWPVCYGHVLWPMEAQEIAAANARFPDTPVESDKTWPEQVHRLLASSLGLFCIALLLIAARQRYAFGDHSYPFKLPLLLLAMVILQGMFGMWTVTLKLWPQVVTAHLLGGFATLSLLVLLTLRLQGGGWQLGQPQVMAALRTRRYALVCIGLLLLQIALGGWTSSNYAALACPDFPYCQTSWWPQMDFAQGFNLLQDIGPNYLGGVMDSAGRTAIHVSHRIGALLVTLAILILCARLWRLGFNSARRWARLLLVLLGLQVALGISNVVFALPLWVAVAHNAGGALLLVTLVGLCQRLFTVSASNTLA